MPAYAPTGAESSRDCNVVNPNELMMIGTNVLIGPLLIMHRVAIAKTIQNFSSTRSSSTCPILKCVLRTPELFDRRRATEMYLSLSLKPPARTGSGGRSHQSAIPHTIVRAPANKYLNVSVYEYNKTNNRFLHVFPGLKRTFGLPKTVVDKRRKYRYVSCATIPDTGISQ